jgi:hypothetical protein
LGFFSLNGNIGDHQNEKIDFNGNVKHAKKFHSIFGRQLTLVNITPREKEGCSILYLSLGERDLKPIRFVSS